MGFWQTLAIVISTALLTWVGHAIVSSLQRRAEKDKALEIEKREAYKRLLALLYDILASVKKENKNKQSQMKGFEERFFQLTRDLPVYASDEVLRLFIQLKNQQSQEPAQVLELFGNLIMAIRKDVGHNATTVTRKELLSTFVTDIDNYSFSDE